MLHVPEVIFFMLNSSEHDLPTTHEIKMLKDVLALKLSNTVFILFMLNLTCISKMNYHAQLNQHEQRFKTSNAEAIYSLM